MDLKPGMYQPPHFREDSLEAQHALIRANPLGLLVTVGPEGPIANPLPFLLLDRPGTKGVLQVHMARPNNQWRDIAAGAPVLVVFQGVDGYITPDWYETKRETGKVVPTWNYVMVQVRGPARVHEDADWLRTQITALTNHHEAPRSEPWQVSEAPDPYITAQMRGIVGVEIEIASIEGKWKVSQNRPAADIARVATGLAEASDPHAHAEMAGLVGRYGRKG